MFNVLKSLLEQIQLNNKFNCRSNCCNTVNAVEEGKMSANEVKNQLHMVHNPFADKTSQPKIPDGKTNESLGFQTQTVQEIGNATGDDTMHIMLYPGMNTGVVIDNTASTIAGRTYYIPTFFGSSGVDWSDVINSVGAWNVRGVDDYALWRVVSQGLQLKLLNPVDQDDGWWEAVRITTELDNEDYKLTTGNDSTQPGGNNGTLAPIRLLQGPLQQQTLANEQSYSTGLLRDLHRVQFELHGQKDHHDFIHQRDEIRFPSGSISPVTVGGAPFEGSFPPGWEEPKDLIQQFCDTSYDMVYIRLHCRANTGTAPFLGSRFHLNCVSNQEVVFDHTERESRFHTKTHTIGTGASSIHMQARRADQNAAKMVM